MMEELLWRGLVNEFNKVAWLVSFLMLHISIVVFRLNGITSGQRPVAITSQRHECGGFQALSPNVQLTWTEKYKTVSLHLLETANADISCWLPSLAEKIIH